MTMETEFLELYKTYEGLLRNDGKEYKAIEDAADDLTQNRMRICRQMRNYFCHQNDSGFLVVSKAQIQFLKDLILAYQAQQDTVEDHMVAIRSGSAARTDSLEFIVKKMKRLHTELLPVWSKEHGLAGIVSLTDVVSGMLKNGSFAALGKTKLVSAFVVPKDMPMKDVLEMSSDVVVVTDDGSHGGQCLGVWIRENGHWK